MSTVAHIALYTFAILFLLSLWSRYWRRRYRLSPTADSVHYAVTRDGWRLALHRYEKAGGEPVVLCHGLGANRFNMDLGPHHSLAEHLRGRGFDVWSLELRGHGHSRPAASRRPRFSFDDFASTDVPAALDLVASVTGRTQLHWVGHSMGGMVAYAYLGTHKDDRIATLCTLGSPADFSESGLAGRLHVLLTLASFLPALPISWLAGLIIPVYWPAPLSFGSHHGSHADSPVVRRAMANLVTPIAPRVMRQFARWLRTRRFTSADGQTSYAEAMSQIDAATCVIAGAGDRLATAAQVRAGFACLGSSEKVFHLMGRESGASIDYHHGDFVIARTAEREVFPLIAKWLASHPLETRRGAARPGRGWNPDAGPNRYDPYTRRLRGRFYRRRSASQAGSPESAATTRAKRG